MNGCTMTKVAESEAYAATLVHSVGKQTPSAVIGVAGAECQFQDGPQPFSQALRCHNHSRKTLESALDNAS